MFQLNHHSRIPTSLQFKVLCYTNFGQQLSICGNTPQFGNWNPLLAHKLVTDDSTYPLWKSVSPIVLNNSNPIEFKACTIANNTITWQRNIENRHLVPQTPSLVEFCFNQPMLKITSKKVTEIQCRQGTWDILREMQGSQSSIQFKSNYPIQKYFMHSRNSLQITKNLSSSDLSGDLYSPNMGSQEIYDKQSNSTHYLDHLTIKYQGTRSVIKTNSIQLNPIIKPDKASLTIRVDNLITKRKRSRSRSLERSDSDNHNKSKQPSSPYLIHIPSIQHIQQHIHDKPKSNFHHLQLQDKFVDQVIQPKTQKSISQKIIQNLCKSIKECILNNDHNDDNKSTSTVTEYETQDEYFTTRQCDVVIENGGSFGDDI